MNTPSRASLRQPFFRLGVKGLLASVCALLASSSGFATDGSWNVNAAGSWATPANPPWLGGIVPGSTSSTTNTDTANFGFTLTTGRAVTVDANRNIGGITFSNTGAGAYTLSSGSLLLSNGGLIQTAAGNGNHTDLISAPLTLQGDGGAFTFTAGATSATSLMSVQNITGISTPGNTTTLTLNGTNTGANAVGGAVGVALSDGALGGKLAIVKSGTGTWMLNSAGTTNPFSGGLTVNEGILKITAGANSLLGAGTVTLNGGALWVANAAARTQVSMATTVAGNFTITSDRSAAGVGFEHGLSGPLSIGAHTLTIQGGTNVTSGTAGYKFTGAATLTGAATFDVINNANSTTQLTFGSTLNNGGFLATFTGTGNSVVTGAVSGAGGLAKSGAGTLTLNGANSYSGDTLVTAGALTLGNASALGGSTYDTASTGTLNLFAGTNNLGGLKGSGNFANGGNLISLGANIQSNTYSGNLSGTGGLTKVGGGTQILEGANAYTGATTINDGTLSVNGSTSASSTVTVASGGTLAGSGTIGGATTVQSGGILAPGSSPGLLTFSNSLTLESNSVTRFEINGTGRGATYDAIDISAGTLTYGGDFTINFGAPTVAGTTFDLFGIGAGVTTTGDFASVTLTGSYTLSLTNRGGVWTGQTGLTASDLSLTFSQSTGDLLVTAVPEPATYALIFGAVALVGTMIRCRRKNVG